MTAFFSDSFTGAAGTLDDRTPDIGYSGVTWQPSLGPGTGLVLNGSGAVASGAPLDTVNPTSSYYGDYTDYGFPPAFEINFSVITGASVGLIGTSHHQGVILAVAAGDITVTFRVWGMYSGGTMTWYANINGGVTYVALPGIAANTEYIGTISMQDGVQTFVFMGHTLTTNYAYGIPGQGLTQLKIEIGGTCAAGYVSASPPSVSGVVADCPMASVSAYGGGSLSVAAPRPTLSSGAEQYGIFFRDTFDGSGSIVGHVPNTAFGGNSWAVDSGAGASLITGKVVAVGDTYIRYGADNTQYDLPCNFTLDFVIDTSSAITSAADGTTVFQVLFGSTSGNTFGFSVSKDYGAWSLSGSSASSSVSPANSTQYSGSIVMLDGAATCTLMGATVADTATGGGFDGLSKVRFFISTATLMESVQAMSSGPSRAILQPPMAILAAWSDEHAYCLVAAPTPIVAAYSGPAVALTAPRPILSANCGGYFALTAPRPTLLATAHDSTGEDSANLAAPSPTLTIRTGASSEATAPSQTLSATGTVTGMATATLDAPKAVVQAAGTVTEMATATLSASSPNLVGYGGAVCSVTVEGRYTIVASGTTGGIASVVVTCPLFALTATATMQNHGSANLIAPSPQLGKSIQAWLVAPSARLTAIGSATITATYEAYAINLGHRPRVTNQELPINEVTHYTNFPFTHVVRYKNSYYGANSTGLYLLEGTTDAGTAIPWAVKTAMDDFKTPVKKTVAAAYFGGRFGPASTVQLHAGEDTPNTYSYSTPRDALAQNHRQVFGKGVKERYFALGASGTGTCELDTIELETHNLSRRI